MPVMTLMISFFRLPYFRSTPFKLGNLPSLARSEVIKLMDITEVVRLAITSKKMSRNIKQADVTEDEYTIAIADKNSCVHIRESKIYLFSCYNAKVREGPRFTRLAVEPWINQNCTTLQNTIRIFEYLRNAVSCKTFGVFINMSHMETTSLKDVLQVPVLQNTKYIRLKKGSITREEIDLVMKYAREDVDIEISRMDMPLDYYHDNAFISKKTYYGDARWVKMEYLLPLKIIPFLTLGKTCFDDHDVNRFLRNFVGSEQCFQGKFVMGIDNMKSDRKVMFNGLVVLKGYRCDLSFHFILAKTEKANGQPLLSAQWFDNCLTLMTSSSDETFCIYGLEGEPLMREWNVLNILNKKKALEEELQEEAGNKEKVLQTKLEEKILKLEEKLNTFKLTYKDGIPVLR